MNIPNDILDFAERWQSKTAKYKNTRLADVFDHFFSAFVLYNFLYNQITDNFKGDEEKAVKSIKKYLGPETIYNDAVIKKNADRIKELISNETFYIRDSSWDTKRIEKLNSPDNNVWSKGLLEIIYKIRCNTFHGSKEFSENQKLILIPCIKIIERINYKVIERIKAS